MSSRVLETLACLATRLSLKYHLLSSRIVGTNTGNTETNPSPPHKQFDLRVTVNFHYESVVEAPGLGPINVAGTFFIDFVPLPPLVFESATVRKLVPEISVHYHSESILGKVEVVTQYPPPPPH